MAGEFLKAFEDLRFSWSVEQQRSGLYHVREDQPGGYYRIFENVPPSLVEPLIAERRREVYGQLRRIRDYMRERQHIIGEQYDTQMMGLVSSGPKAT